MTLAIRMILILTLIVPVTCAVSGQETTTSEETTTAAATATAVETETAQPAIQTDIHDIRAEFTTLIRHHPWELGAMLALDHRLLTNQEFLEGYPEVQRYLAARPEIAGNPRFFLAHLEAPTRYRRSGFEDVMEGMAIFATFALIAFALAWLVRTIIEQKRWNRLSRQQSEVHNKILDRFGTSSELLEYVRSPAGTKFLESAPIPVRAEEQPRPSAPQSRVMLSIQIGIVVAAGALGMLLVSLRLDEASADGLFALGAIGFCLGAGFIASALISLFLSRRLGNFENDPGIVR